MKYRAWGVSDRRLWVEEVRVLGGQGALRCQALVEVKV